MFAPSKETNSVSQIASSLIALDPNQQYTASGTKYTASQRKARWTRYIQLQTDAARIIALAPRRTTFSHHQPPNTPPSRSAYFWQWSGELDHIYINKPIHGYKGLYVLAHEVGHAMDRNHIHPAQQTLKQLKPTSSTYRAETAATVMTEWLMSHTEFSHWNRSKTIRQAAHIDEVYCDRYLDSQAPDEPNRDKVLAHTMKVRITWK